MQFTDFESLVVAAGLKARKCTVVHWQIIGGVKPVNFYPTTGRIFVNGSNKGQSGDAATAIECAKGDARSSPVRVERLDALFE